MTLLSIIGDAALWLIGAIGAVAFAWFTGRRSGRKHERLKGQVDDYERADDIRRRARRADQRLRDFDDAGYRD